MNLQNRTGWRASPPSDKDRLYPLASIGMANVSVPPAASNEQWISRIDDQGNKPRCVAYGTAHSIELYLKSLGLPYPAGGFSKAWLYEMCKRYDGIPGEDGTYIKTALWVALNFGLCPDYLCPTTDYMGNEPVVITDAMMEAAAKYKISGFSKLIEPDGSASLNQIKQVIAAGGFPIIASIVDNEWVDIDPYILRIEGRELGGHCTFLCRYDDAQVIQNYTGFARDVNSWGTEWADGGKADMSYGYMRSKFPDGTPALLEAWAFSVAKPEPVKRCRICEWFRRWFR